MGYKAYVLCLTAMLFALGGCGGGGDGDQSGMSITSAQGFPYPIQVRLPRGYANSQDTFPVIYATDGEGLFAPMAKVLDEMDKPVILVAIGNAGRRHIDFVTPGSRANYDFITQKVIPAIEAQYRVRTDRRVLAGFSLGGLFAMQVLFMDRLGDKYFTDFVSLDGSITDMVDPFFKPTFDLIGRLEQQYFDTSDGSLPVNLVFAGARCCYYPFNEAFFTRLQNRGYRDLHATLLPPYDVTHPQIAIPGFRGALPILFP